MFCISNLALWLMVVTFILNEWNKLSVVVLMENIAVASEFNLKKKNIY